MESFKKEFEHLVLKLEDIKSATNNFDEKRVIGSGGFGKVYKGEVSHYKGRSMVAFKRLDRKFGQGDTEFWKEIMMLSRYTHENLISLLGYCIEEGEMILAYEHASNGSLDHHLGSTTLTWSQRIKICLDAARGLSYLHDGKGTQQRVLHRDIKSANILLDENWNAKVSDMGLSKLGPANQEHTALMTNAVGTPGYCDPLYMELGYLTKESDVYSFGVVLFEVLFGKSCFQNINGQPQILVRMWQKSYEENNIDEFIFHCMKQQMDSSSLRSFSDIASQCLKRSRDERPRMADVVAMLEIALADQEIYEKMKLPTNYEDIIKTAVPTLNYGSEEELKKLLLKGTLLNSGKTWFSLNTDGKHYEMISIAECLDTRGSESVFSSKYKSRFSVGSYIPHHKIFMTCVEPHLLSPNATYIMNLVFKKKNLSELYVGLSYEFKGETYYTFLSDEREDGWSTAEMFQFTTNQRGTVDKLNIRFNIEYCDIKAVEGIEFQPVEEVGHGVLVGNQVNRQASDSNWKENLHTVDKHGKKYIMLPTRVASKDDGWTWKYLPKTRFEEVPQDRRLSKFCISCNIESKILSGDTTYAAYLVYKQKAYYFQPAPAQIEDKNSYEDEILYIYLQSPQTPVIISGEVCQDTLNQPHRPNIKGLPKLRSDGWMELKIWEFTTNPNTTTIPMDVELSRYDARALKRLEPKGIEFRPREKN